MCHPRLTCCFTIYSGLPWWLSWQRICLQCGRPGFDPWVGKISWRMEWLPTLIFWPGEFHELYSPWGGKESKTTERLSLHSLYIQGPGLCSSHHRMRNWERMELQKMWSQLQSDQIGNSAAKIYHRSVPPKTGCFWNLITVLGHWLIFVFSH